MDYGSYTCKINCFNFFRQGLTVKVLPNRSQDVSKNLKYLNETWSFVSVQGVPGEGGVPGAVGARVSLHVKASRLHLFTMSIHKPCHMRHMHKGYASFIDIIICHGTTHNPINNHHHITVQFLPFFVFALFIKCLFVS